MTRLAHSDDREPTAAFDKRKAMLSSLRRVTLATPLIALLFAVLSIAPAEAGASCGARTLSQPFAPWLDLRDYFLIPGGDLESASGWTLGGGARLVSGNEPFKVHGAGDGKSLELPMGAWARSTSTCVDSDEPTMRFFARNTGSPLSTLAVEVRIWQPSLPVMFKLSLNQLLGGTTTVDFRFTTLGLGGDWQVDDVYVDPFKDRAAS
jgi:hypothetical protein